METQCKQTLARTMGEMRNVLTGTAVICVVLILVMFVSGIKPYVVKSGSMEPEIRTGSLCFIQTRAKFDEIEAGDMIAFETSGGMLVTHRVVRVENGRAETKGDANEVSDGFTTDRNNFRGKTLFSIPYLGYLRVWIGGENVVFICFLSLFVLFSVKNTQKKS